MKFVKPAALALLPIIISMAVCAQADSIDVFIHSVMQKRKIPGLQLAIVERGKLVKTGNYGLANVQDSIPVSNKTVFPINSITKAFTGVAIMQLVEAGKINLSSPVSTYVPGLPDSWKPVTVLQLLSHISGIPDIVNEEESVLIAATPGLAWKKVLQLPVDFKPGERFSYNQTNYLLLGQIIDTTSGLPFTEFIKTAQLQKAGMVNTIRAGFGASREVIAQAAGGYRVAQGKLVNMFFSFPPQLQTAAGMSSTATEMAQWIISLQNNRLLKEPSSLRTLWTPALLNNGKAAGFSSLLNGYAVGWPVVARKEHPAAAAVGGGRSAVFVYPEDDLSIVVLTNLAGGSPEVFIDEIAGFFIPGMKEANGFGLSTPVKQVRAALEKTGYTRAIEEVKDLMKKSGSFRLTEKEVNSWGYKLVQQNRVKDAIEVFKLNVFLYPKSANAFDSLGEAYAEIGDTSLAISNYEQSLRLDPGNRNASEQLVKLKGDK